MANRTQTAGAMVDQNANSKVFGRKNVSQDLGFLCGELLVSAFLKSEEYFRPPDPLLDYCCDILSGAKICKANASRQGCRLPMLAE